MKTYSGVALHNYERVAIPNGREFPLAPVTGELFYLTIETAPHNTMNPSYVRGAYFFNGVEWQKLNDTPRGRRATIIGAQEHEIEKLRKGYKVTMAPLFDDGVEIASVTIKPTSKRSTFSGSCSMWLDSLEPQRRVWAAVWRAGENRLAGLSLQTVKHDEPTSLSFTFFDAPNSDQEQLYVLKMYTDTVGTFFINRGFSVSFDAVGQTAFTVEENT